MKEEKKTPKPKKESKQQPMQQQLPVEQKEDQPVQQRDDRPTQQEIEDIKEDILTQGLMNPYALILYQYMQKSTYETNVEVVLSMRESLMNITRINQLILDELKEDKQEDL
jgi:hypothetical protein